MSLDLIAEETFYNKQPEKFTQNNDKHIDQPDRKLT